MSHEQARQFINEAGDAIRRGQFKEALEAAERSIALDSSDSEAHVLRAVAYAHLNERDLATDSFREAIAVAPHNQKAFYNFAVHLYGLGEKGEALEMAREAMRLAPDHGPSRDLVSRIEKETGAAPSPDEATAFSNEPAPPPTIAPPAMAPPEQEAGYYRAGYYEYQQPVHSLGFIEGMGKTWDGIGWALVALGIAAFIYEGFMIVRVFSTVTKMMGSSHPANPFLMQSQFGNPAIGLVVDLFRFFIVLWMCLDIADRRENWLWILPNIIACCCFGFNAFILAAYMLFGRSTR